MNELLGYHVVLTTHNSRTSDRMRLYRVRKGPAIRLNLDEEIELTRIIAQIIRQFEIRCIAYNSCCDHVHLLIVCQPEHLSGIIQKIKSISSRKFHQSDLINSHNHELHSGHLWSQKYYRAHLDDWELASLSNIPGELYRSTHLMNTLEYIRNNRQKHELELSEELNRIIAEFTMTLEDAYRISDSD